MKIYISGPISNEDPKIVAKNIQAFREAAASLIAKGYTVTNLSSNLDPSVQWVARMRSSVSVLATTCTAMALLPGYSYSKGAMTELNLAQSLGFDIRMLGEWVALHSPPPPPAPPG